MIAELILSKPTMSSDTDMEISGSYTELLAVLPKEKEEKIRHTFPKQIVCVEPLKGNLGIMLPDRRVVVKPGQKFKIPMNTEHAFYNADEGDIAFREFVKPALHTSWLIQEMSAASARKQSRWEYLFTKAYIFDQVKSEYYHSGIPQFIHKHGYAFMARIGNWLGLVKGVQPLM
jgi:hypothetical protein